MTFSRETPARRVDHDLDRGNGTPATEAAASGTPGKRTLTAALSGRVFRRATGGAISKLARRYLVRAAAASGRPLPDALRRRLERALDRPLDHVRVHTGEDAALGASALAARAYTIGADIYFAAGAYDTVTAEGQHLLAHEVAHTVQGGGAPSSTGALDVSDPAERAEQQADQFADAFARGESAPAGDAASGRPGAVHRVPQQPEQLPAQQLPAAETPQEPTLTPEAARRHALAEELRRRSEAVIKESEQAKLVVKVMTVRHKDELAAKWDEFTDLLEEFGGAFAEAAASCEQTPATADSAADNPDADALEATGTPVPDKLIAQLAPALAKQQPPGGEPREPTIVTHGALTELEKLLDGESEVAAAGAKLNAAEPGSADNLLTRDVKAELIAAADKQIGTLDRALAQRPGLGDAGAAHAERMLLRHDRGVWATGKGTHHGIQSGETGTASSDCITYAMDVMRAAFASVGRAADWQAAVSKALGRSKQRGLKGLSGIDLMTSLQDLGWVGLHIVADTNPKSSENASYSHHLVEHGMAKAHRPLYGSPKTGVPGVTVDRVVPNYAPQKDAEGTVPATNEIGLAQLRRLPLAFMAMRGGGHTSLFVHGKVYEAHWGATSSSDELFVATELTEWTYQSALLVAPAEDVARSFAPTAARPAGR